MQTRICLALVLAMIFGCTSNPPAIDARKPAADETGTSELARQIGDLFQSIVIQRHGKTGSGVKRAVFLKFHGCAKASFEVKKTAPELSTGLFATPSMHEAWVRISSDTVPSTPDSARSTVGFGVKVLGVAGAKVLPGEEQAATQDFLTQNFNVFFVDTAKDFLEFTQQSLSGKFDEYVQKNPKTDALLKAMEKDVQSVRDTTFWSTTPYHFGETYAKYKIVPCAGQKPIAHASSSDPNFLQARMEKEFKRGACYEFQIQRRTNEAGMPIDQATVEWSETESKPVTVATIRIAPQDISKNADVCESYSYNPFHALEAHKPAGSVNEARGIIYKRLSEYRRQRDQLPTFEPR